MHLAGCWTLAVLAAALLLARSSAEASGKTDKAMSNFNAASPANIAGSLEDELESSLPQPDLTGEQQLKAAAAAAAASVAAPAAAGSHRAEHKAESHQEKQKPASHHEAAIPGIHHARQRQQQQEEEQPKESRGARPSPQDLREMFHHLLQSMTEAERKSLTLRLGKESVKRTFSQMRDEVRAMPGSALTRPARKRVASAAASAAMPPSEARAAVLRMRRSLLRGAMESGMPAARRRRRKRDLIDYSPEEYQQLAAMLARQPVGYVEDAEGNIRLADGENVNGGDVEGDGENYGDADDDDNDEDDGEEQKRRVFYGDSGVETDAAEDVEERAESPAAEEFGDAVDEEAAAAAATDALASPSLPVPPPGRQPLTMFLVRMAGVKGLFVPLNQDRAEQMAVELSGEAAIAEAAEAEAEAEAEDEAEAKRRSQLEAAGVAELKRFAEKLARRVPPGY